ncbi:hypothetical protein, partial [Phocaeicola sp.]|uniref:hypothetical protein n=1 Tax=Phocaeicola sp. TaxID=2773926 RepID=UPI00307B8AE5
GLFQKYFVMLHSLVDSAVESKRTFFLINIWILHANTLHLQTKEKTKRTNMRNYTTHRHHHYLT